LSFSSGFVRQLLNAGADSNFERVVALHERLSGQGEFRLLSPVMDVLESQQLRHCPAVRGDFGIKLQSSIV
jgi:hypothetical protein